MNKTKEKPNTGKSREISAKDCAYIAVFVALVIVAQLALSLVPGVEVVTVLFVAFSFAFGVRRSMIAATAFALLRQIAFGFYPLVLILYLVYFNLLALLFGFIGKRAGATPKNLLLCVFTLYAPADRLYGGIRRRAVFALGKDLSVVGALSENLSRSIDNMLKL